MDFPTSSSWRSLLAGRRATACPWVRGEARRWLLGGCAGITNLDPLAYDLLFERFLNPERVSMPDFDVDFCMEGRDRVIGHVADLYGAAAVSQIVHLRHHGREGRGAGRCLVQGKPYGLADKLSKMIPFEVGMTLHKALEQEPTLKATVARTKRLVKSWRWPSPGRPGATSESTRAVWLLLRRQLTDFVPRHGRAGRPYDPV